ncbi:MAG: hypothetical protein ABSG58_03040 [Acidimicrobiales bacterium]|jgi:hypothetical protein
MIVTVTWWVLIGAGVALEGLARARPRSIASLARIGAWLASSIPGRVLMWMGWIFVGVHLFTRYGVRGR